MIRRLRWQAQVVISITLLLLACSRGFTQQKTESNKGLEKKITLAVQAISLEEVLQELSKQTQFYFIYNASSVDATSKTFAVAFHQQTLASVLKSLEDKMNVTFRVEGKYVIVKKSLTRETATSSGITISPAPTKHVNSALSTFASAGSTSVATRTMREYPFTISYETLQRNLLHLNYNFPIVDTSVIKIQSMLHITNPKRVRQLFTSIRMIANEYSGGIEIHAGIPSLYAVVNGGLMTEGYFRYGYGLGTAIPLKNNFTFKPLYTFATVREKQDVVVDEYANIVIADGLKLTGRHHQLKFIFQYELSRRVHIHAGPTFNFLKTLYSYQKPPSTVIYDVVSGNAGSVPVNQGYNTPTLWMRQTVFVASAPADSYTFKSWTGFEAGISYLIKFQRH